MTDRLLVTKCAFALGYRIESPQKISTPPPHSSAVRCSVGKKAPFWFSPMTNKEQAFNLITAFDLSLSHNDGIWTVTVDALGNFKKTVHSDLQYAIMAYVSMLSDTDILEAV